MLQMANQRAAILVFVVQTKKFFVSAGLKLAKICVKIHFDNIKRSHKTCETIDKAFRANNLQFGEVTLGSRIKSLESIRNMKFDLKIVLLMQ